MKKVAFFDELVSPALVGGFVGWLLVSVFFL